MAETLIMGGASALPTTATRGNVVQFVPRDAVRLSVAGPLPSEEMSPAEYAEAWTTLCCYAEEACNWRRYVESRWTILLRTDPRAAENFRAEREPAFQQMRAFARLVASMPVPQNLSPTRTRSLIRRKKAIIGKVWLREAVGPVYDAMRAGVKADEALLLLRSA